MMYANAVYVCLLHLSPSSARVTASFSMSPVMDREFVSGSLLWQTRQPPTSSPCLLTLLSRASGIHTRERRLVHGLLWVKWSPPKEMLKS